MNYLKQGGDYLAASEQIAYARQSQLTDGDGAGQRIIDIFNGAGLACTITPDRALNIVECSYRGIPLVYRTPGGHRRPRGVFQQDWSAGLLTTCGLRNIGVASGDEPQHGRISQLGASGVGVSRNASGDLVIRGSVTEGWLFGPNLVLEREITVSCARCRITVADRVVNRGAAPDAAALLYHCNFGYPFASPDLTLEAEEHKVEPRDEVAAQGLADWQRMDAPAADCREQCFRHFLTSGDDGMAAIRAVNRKLGVAVRVAYDPRTLPWLVQWKNCLKHGYVLGLEPGNGSLLGRKYDLEHGLLARLAPGEAVDFHVWLDFESV
ncbi:MAG: aldose 1-epimerase family protein [Lentisphaeria bacterium]|nr:aldose 1-epimerase family protein [Lentisphaeria bacterium]